MRRWTSLAPAALLAAGACLASKGDIRLLQDDLRATREQISRMGADAAQRDSVTRSQLVARVTAAATATARVSDSVRVLSQKLASFQALTAGQLDQVVKDVIQTQELLGQTTRNLQQMRAQAEAAREQASAISPPLGAPDTTQRVPIGPGPATLFQNAFTQLKQGGFQTSRHGFEELLKNFPNADEAPAAQLHIGEAFEGEGNQGAADSVYQLVVTRYPKTPAAPTALYKRGMMLWNANQRPEARKSFQRVVSEYPRAIEADFARGMLARK